LKYLPDSSESLTRAPGELTFCIRRERGRTVFLLGLSETIQVLAMILCPLGLIALLVVGFVVMVYNSLVGRRVETQNAWSQIDVQLKRRYDLIPNLVETVKGYATHEKETFERVIQARNAAMNASGPAEHAAAENALSGTLKTLFAVAEAYPDLKANTSFLSLQEELKSTENRIGFARQHYNDSVSGYNATLQRFPSNLIANTFAFRPAEFFKLDEAEAAQVREAPRVKF
jgi:LemA protein